MIPFLIVLYRYKEKETTSFSSSVETHFRKNGNTIFKEESLMSTTVKQPAWLDNAVFYEIYPQSFCDTNADGIGDINGIISKLDYIKELGCTALWLNPCFQSPFGDAGYDVEDYYTVAPRYGTNEDLANLFAEAHKRDMHVILDLVPGHTAVTLSLIHI